MSENDLRKKFYELSEIAQFHLASRLFGERAIYPYYNESLTLRTDIRSRLLETIKEDNKLHSPEGEHFAKLINDVLGTELDEDAKNNENEQQKLEAAKQQIKLQLIDVLVSIREYMDSILKLQAASRKKHGVDEADKKRTRIHDKLISNINILNRSLVWWFGDFDPDKLNDEQYEMYEKQEDTYISHHFPRLNISQNGILPPLMNIANRKVITQWAKKIYKDIAAIRNLTSTV